MRLKLKPAYLMAAIALIGSVTFTACSDDDNNPTPLSPEAVNGYYSGNMEYSIREITPQALTEPVAVEAQITDKAISFDKFPIAALITAIVGDAAAPAIIEAVGDIKYSIAFNPTVNSENNAISLEMKPEPLQISFKLDPEAEELTTVVVKVIASESGSFTSQDKKLNFKLVIGEAMLGEINALDKKTVNLSFSMLNTVKKPVE